MTTEQDVLVTDRSLPVHVIRPITRMSLATPLKSVRRTNSETHPTDSDASKEFATTTQFMVQKNNATDALSAP